MNAEEILERARQEIRQRETDTAVRREQPWLWAFLGLAATVVIGVWFLPGNTLADRLHLMVQGVCAQAHYLQIGTLQLPLCARNTGIYSSFMASLIYLLVLGKGRAGAIPSLPISLLLVLGVVAMGVDGVNSLLLDMGGYNFYEPQNILRVITGLLMGTSMAAFLLLIFNMGLRGDADFRQPVIATWAEYAGALLLDAIVFGLIWISPGFMFYPIAILSVVGIVGLLLMTNMFVVAMISGLERKLMRLVQLSRPGVWALLLTIGELGALAWLRTLAEPMNH